MTHDGNLAARIAPLQPMEGVAHIAAFRNVLVDCATKGFNGIGGRIIGINRRDPKARFEPVP